MLLLLAFTLWYSALGETDRVNDLVLHRKEEILRLMVWIGQWLMINQNISYKGKKAVRAMHLSE